MARLVTRSDNTFVIEFGAQHYHSTEYDNLTRNANFIRRTVSSAPLI